MAQSSPPVAWPGISRGGGDLDNPTQLKIRDLITDYGSVLNLEIKAKNLNPFIFHIYREFNLLVALNPTQLLCALSPSSGMPLHTFLDWRVKNSSFGINELVSGAQQQLGWSNISILIFPSNVIEMESSARRSILEQVAKKAVEAVELSVERKKDLFD